MKRTGALVLTTLLTLLSGLAGIGAEPADALQIRDDKPARKWDRAYPVGNGRLGAMLWGLYPVEQVLINEETIWENDGPMETPEDAAVHLEAIRELVAQRDYFAADRYFEKHLLHGQRPYHYQLAGWLEIHYPAGQELAGMHRSLDMTTGIATNVYALADGNVITQSVYASAPQDVIVVEVRAKTPISFGVSMRGPAKKDDAAPRALSREGELILAGQASGKMGTRHVTRIRSHAPGLAQSEGDALTFADVTSATLILSVATDVNRERPASGPLPEGWQKKAQTDLQKAAALKVEALCSNAVADHRQYFERVDVEFGTTAKEIRSLPTEARINRLKESGLDDPDLVEDYFQFGRYLLIASSRPGTFPANLQGVWNAHLRPPWRSDYHLDVNLQMNYWLAETTNLAECHMPVFDLIGTLQPQGREMAKRCGMKGWAMGICTDLWGNARTMSSRARWSGNFLCGQWLIFQILHHYRFNRDPRFLESQWDVLTAATEFAEAWLMPGPDGTLITRPGSSPENEFTYTDKNGETQVAAICEGTTYDQHIILEIFKDYLQAADALGKSEDPYVKKIAALLPKVYRPRIGADGRLMEWAHEFGEKQPGHRHLSHLIGAYPGNQINLDDDPKMRNAVTRSLQHRLENGGGGIGWSRAWVIALFARLSNAQEAYQSLEVMLARSTLPSLLNNRRPFQIEGNFGGTAAIAEMLLHSHNGEIKLLPALPTDHWPEGAFAGLRARGDLTVDVRWKNGRLTQATIRAGDHAQPSVKVVYGGKSLTVELAPGQKADLSARDFQMTASR